MKKIQFIIVFLLVLVITSASGCIYVTPDNQADLVNEIESLKDSLNATQQELASAKQALHELQTATGPSGYLATPIAQSAPPVVVNFSAIPGTIAAGYTSTLQWNVTGASAVYIDNNIGQVALAGSQSVSPLTTTTYTLTASNGTGIITASTTIIVSTLSVPVIVSFNASPDSITASWPVYLHWNVTGADSVSLNQGIGTVPSFGTRNVYPSFTTTYILTARNSYGNVTKSVTVVVTSPYLYYGSNTWQYLNPCSQCILPPLKHPAPPPKPPKPPCPKPSPQPKHFPPPPSPVPPPPTPPPPPEPQSPPPQPVPPPPPPPVTSDNSTQILRKVASALPATQSTAIVQKPPVTSEPLLTPPLPSAATPIPESSTPPPEPSTASSESSSPLPEISTPLPEPSMLLPVESTLLSESSATLPEIPAPLPPPQPTMPQQQVLVESVESTPQPDEPAAVSLVKEPEIPVPHAPIFPMSNNSTQPQI